MLILVVKGNKNYLLGTLWETSRDFHVLHHDKSIIRRRTLSRSFRDILLSYKIWDKRPYIYQ
jgi:hypothetical protein